MATHRRITAELEWDGEVWRRELENLGRLVKASDGWEWDLHYLRSFNALAGGYNPRESISDDQLIKAREKVS